MTDDLRSAAFAQVRRLEKVYGDNIPWAAISQGFDFDGDKILLASKPVGIFKPKQLSRGALSIRSSKPRAGRKNIYTDAEDIDGTFVYALQKSSSENHFNRALMECFEDRLPLIYFQGVSEGAYTAIYPCYIESIDMHAMVCKLSIDSLSIIEKAEAEFWFAKPIDRRYAAREVRVRLHHAEFRMRIIKAYGARCAMTSLAVPELLEAAHIVPDAHHLGVAEVNNGLCLSRIHHRAFDSNLIGITPDYRVQISDRLLAASGSEFLEYGVKALHGQRLFVPKSKLNWPDKDALAARFEEFRDWN